jgi:hypothetical protein
MISKNVLMRTVLALSLFTVTSPAFSASSGWMDANEANAFSGKVLRKNNIPTSIQCKNNDAVAGMDRRNTLIKFEYQPNPKNNRWSWAWGANVGKINADLTKKGFKKVSQGSFRRASGLVIPCAIWHGTP